VKRILVGVVVAGLAAGGVVALAARGGAARADVVTARASYEAAQASLAVKQVDLDRAREDLRYVYIYAPIDGTVVQRNVDVG